MLCSLSPPHPRTPILGSHADLKCTQSQLWEETPPPVTSLSNSGSSGPDWQSQEWQWVFGPEREGLWMRTSALVIYFAEILSHLQLIRTSCHKNWKLKPSADRCFADWFQCGRINISYLVLLLDWSSYVPQVNAVNDPWRVQPEAFC